MLSPAAPLHPFPVPAHREQGRSTPSLGRASSLPSHSTAPACSQREGLRPRAEQPVGPVFAGAAVTTAMAGWVPANLRIFPLLAIPPVPTVPCRTAAPFGLFWVPPRFCPSPCPISPYSCTVLRWPSAALGGGFSGWWHPLQIPTETTGRWKAPKRRGHLRLFYTRFGTGCQQTAVSKQPVPRFPHCPHCQRCRGGLCRAGGAETKLPAAEPHKAACGCSPNTPPCPPGAVGAAERGLGCR